MKTVIFLSITYMCMFICVCMTLRFKSQTLCNFSKIFCVYIYLESYMLYAKLKNLSLPLVKKGSSTAVSKESLAAVSKESLAAVKDVSSPAVDNASLPAANKENAEDVWGAHISA